MNKATAIFSAALAYVLLLLYGYGVSDEMRIYWPAAGVLLASLVIAGFRQWPAVISVAFVLDECVRFAQDSAYQFSLSNAEYFLANEVGAAVAALVLKLWGGPKARWLSLAGFLRILVAGTVVGGTVAATLGTLQGIGTGDGLDNSLFWRLWWLGEALGFITIGTLALWSWELAQTPKDDPSRPRPGNKSVITLVAYFFLVLTLFGGERGLAQPFLLYPPLIWVAVQLGPWYTSTLLTATVILGVDQTARQVGPFVNLGSPESSATAVQLFSLILAGSSLSISTNLADRRRSSRRREEVLSQLHASERRYKALFEHVGVPILVVGNHGVERANPAACRLWERTSEEMLVPLETLLTPEQPDGKKFKDLWPNAFEEGAVLPWQATTSQGKTLDLDLYVSRVVLPTGTRVQLVARDKTRQIELEKMLEAERVRLREEVSTATSELQETHNQLERANVRRQRFLATISHELRTPLTAILGRTETMLEGLWGPLTEEQQNSLKRISESGQFLDSLVSDLLDLAKVESLDVPAEIAHHNLAELCQSSLRLVNAMAEKKEIELVPLVCDEQLSIPVDARFCKQILVNLLSNAVKFTPSGGRVGVQVSTDDDWVRMTVWDTGSGVGADLKERLFQPFVRGDESVPGFGLGLALVKRLSQAMNGEIIVESEEGEGARFVVKLPLKPSSRTDLLDSRPNLKILLREAEESALQTTARYFHKRGYQTVKITPSAALVDEVLREQPQILILEMDRPTERTVETLQQLGSLEKSNRPITVVLADECRDECRKVMTESGASLILLKPTPLPDLERLALELVKT